MNFFIKEAKKKIERAKNSEEFFAVFQELASSIDLDLSEYCNKLKRRFEVRTLSDELCYINHLGGVGEGWIQLPDGSVSNPASFMGKFIMEEKVKDFIKNIKERLCKNFPTKSTQELLFEVIDQQAGDKLT